MSLGYTRIGHGPQNVLVFHGWFGDHMVWEPCFRAIDKDLFTYTFIDYRGYGKSADLTGDYSMREIARDATNLVKKLGITRLHVVGHSMGGMAMQRFILDCGPGIDVLSAVGVMPVPACGAQLEGDYWSLFSGAVEDDDKRYTIADATTGNRLGQAWLQSMVAASRDTTTPDAFAGYLNAWSKENFREDIDAIRTPMLVLGGEFDGAVPVEVIKSTYTEWFSRCSMEVISNCGHYPMQETPVRLINLMETFMAKYADN